MAILFCLILLIFAEYAVRDGILKGFIEWIYHLGMAVFFISCYIALYHLLSDRLSFLVGDFNVPGLDSKVALPEKGSVLDLKSLGLTERQIDCINYTVTTSYSYRQIAEKLITSESTVKKDMQDLFRLFGVKNREMLRLLLVQYTIL